MAGATSSEEAIVLDVRFNRSGLTAGLFTVIPTADDGSGGTEVSTSGTGYGRISLGAGDEWEDAVEGDPSYKIGPAEGFLWVFDDPIADWGTINGWGIWEGSRLVWYGSLITPLTVLSGNPAPQWDNAHPITLQAGDKNDTF